MKVLQLKECPACGRMAPYLQSLCDCGHRFNGSERRYKTCTRCGSVVAASRLFCDCGHFLPFSRQSPPDRELDSAYQSGVTEGIAQEQQRSKEEWKRFFSEAKLKNTITGEPINSIEDFRRWKTAFDAAKAERDRKSTKERSNSAKQEHSQAGSREEHYQVMSDAEVASEAILGCSIKIFGELKDALTEKHGEQVLDVIMLYVIPGLLCALAESLFFQNSIMTKDVIVYLSTIDSSLEDSEQWEIEEKIWSIHDSLKRELDVLSRDQNPLVVFFLTLKKVVLVPIDDDGCARIMEIIKEFGAEYRGTITYKRATQYGRPTPSTRRLEKYVHQRYSQQKGQG